MAPSILPQKGIRQPKRLRFQRRRNIPVRDGLSTRNRLFSLGFRPPRPARVGSIRRMEFLIYCMSAMKKDCCIPRTVCVGSAPLRQDARLTAGFYARRGHAERWRSGRTRRSRKPKYPQGYRGFESHPLRHLSPSHICRLILRSRCTHRFRQDSGGDGGAIGLGDEVRHLVG